MRRVVFGLCVLLLFSLSASAADIILEWDFDAPGFQVGAFRIYQSSDNATWTMIQEVSGTARSVTIAGLTPGLYYFRVAAKNEWGEGPASPALATSPGLPPAPSNLRWKVLVTAAIGAIAFLSLIGLLLSSVKKE